MKQLIFVSLILLISNSVVFADYMPRFNNVNVRAEPSTNSAVISKVFRGEKLVDLGNPVEDVNRIWLLIETVSGIRGYVAEDVVDTYTFSDTTLPVSKTASKKSKQEANSTLVESESLQRIKISLKDLNRLTCTGKISDPIYSRDKEIEIVRGGEKDLFIKISPVQTNYNGVSDLTFNTFERELFVECLGKIYNLVLLPEDGLPTQTIIIKSIMVDLDHTKNIERSSTYENLISSLIKAAYLEQAPAGYTSKKGNISYKFKELDMRLRYEYKGFDYVVEDWEIISRSENATELEENIFVPFIKSPRALSFTVPRLLHGEAGRLLVVRLNKN